MNNSRRKRINKSTSVLQDAKVKLELALSEEQVALGKTPEDDEHEEMRDDMEEIVSYLEDSLSSLEDALSSLDNGDF